MKISIRMVDEDKTLPSFLYDCKRGILLKTEGQEQIVFFIILILIPVLLLVILISLLLVLANIGKMNKTVLTDCAITLGDDMILTESAYARSEVQWAAIQKLVKTRSHLFLFVRKLDDLVIPKRAFNSDEECNRFWDMCQAKLKT